MEGGSRTILIVGGTGMLGRPVAERMLAEGYRVRLLVRDPAGAAQRLGSRFEFAGGDVTEPDTLPAAVQGCAFVHVSLRAETPADLERVEVQGTRNVALAAARAGVERLTYLSGAGIEIGDPGLLPVKTKRAAEAAIEAAGLPYTILRATHFMESLDLFVRGREAVLLGSQPHRFHYLAAADFARQVAAALRDSRTANRDLVLLGPQAFTMAEALAIYVRLVRPDLRLRHMPLLLPRLAAALTGNARLRLVTALFDSFRRLPEGPGGAEADALVGRATTTLNQWCAARAAAAASADT